jgi:hypothetical protein
MELSLQYGNDMDLYLYYIWKGENFAWFAWILYIDDLFVTVMNHTLKKITCFTNQLKIIIWSVWPRTSSKVF